MREVRGDKPAIIKALQRFDSDWLASFLLQFQHDEDHQEFLLDQTSESNEKFIPKNDTKDQIISLVLLILVQQIYNRKTKFFQVRGEIEEPDKYLLHQFFKQHLE